MPVMLEINKTKHPILVWTDEAESGALLQAINIANNMPVVSHVAIMPDVHQGYGMPIGGVLPLKGAISPNCVGVDIGCGMRAVKTNLTGIDIDTQKELFRRIRESIPVGFSHRKEPVPWDEFDALPSSPVVKAQVDSARYQLGTLGGGNHFIEFQKGDDECIWFMIHSGSRNLGLKVANYYHKLALDGGVVPGGIADLAFFEDSMELYHEYVEAMGFCLKFAMENRRVMARTIKKILAEVMGNQHCVLDELDCHHNYAETSVVDGTIVVLHRKGATDASAGSRGIIPGSMGTASYIVWGRGSEKSFESCSHGAGRVMSRAKAKKTISKDSYIESLRGIGLECGPRDMHLDEAPAAYKNIDTVMANQEDLVSVAVKLMPYQLPAIKG